MREIRLLYGSNIQITTSIASFKSCKIQRGPFLSLLFHFSVDKVSKRKVPVIPVIVVREITEETERM